MIPFIRQNVMKVPIHLRAGRMNVLIHLLPEDDHASQPGGKRSQLALA